MLGLWEIIAAFIFLIIPLVVAGVANVIVEARQGPQIPRFPRL